MAEAATGWRQRAAGVLLATALAGATVLPAAARDIRTGADAGNTVIRGSGAKRTVDCRGGRVAVYGDRNHLTVRNCGDVMVKGSANEVSAEFAVAGHVEVDGARNRISWHAPAGVRVKIGNVGTRNIVTRY